MKKFRLLHIFLFTTIFVLFGFVGAKRALAGFGVSPATLDNNRLKRGSSYTQEFTISRSDTSEELNLTLAPDLGQMEDWFTFSPGTQFTLSEGQQFFNFSTTLTVPIDAKLSSYTGYLRVLEQTEHPKGIQIVEGVRLDINIKLTSKDIVELLVRNVDIDDIYVGDPIILTMLIENLGNVDTAPSKVVLDIMDLNRSSLVVLESTDIQSVPAGTIQELAASFNNDLAQGEYYANTTVYIGSKVLREELLVFRVNAVSEKLPETGSISKVVRDIVDNSGYLLALIFAILLAFIAWFFILVKIRKESEKKNKSKEFATMILFAKVSLLFLVIAFFIVVILFVKSMIRGGDGEIVTLFMKKSEEQVATENDSESGQDVLGAENVQGDQGDSKGASLVVVDPRTKGKIPIYYTPKRTAEIVYLAKQEATFKVIGELDEWYRVELPDGKRGWVHRFDIKTVR